MKREEKKELQSRKREYPEDAQRLRELIREFRMDVEARDRDRHDRWSDEPAQH